MSKLKKIKAEQLKEDPNFYGDGEKAKAKEKPKAVKPEVKARPLSKLDKIKAEQLEENPALYETKTAEVSAPAATGSNMFEQLQAAMVTDVARIKQAKKIKEKVSLKRKLLPSYLEFVKDYMNQGHDYPNSVAVQVMVWLFDVGDIEQALELGLYLDFIGNQVMPDRFGRDLITFICDAVYDWSKVQLDSNNTASPYLDNLVNHVDTTEHDLHPAVVSKNLAMLAKHCEREGKFAECVELCKRAETVNPEGAGVKTMKIKALAKVEAAKAE